MGTERFMVFPWRSTKGVKPDALKGARPVLNGGDEETGLCRPRLVATQRECGLLYCLSGAGESWNETYCREAARRFLRLTS